MRFCGNSRMQFPQKKPIVLIHKSQNRMIETLLQQMSCLTLATVQHVSVGLESLTISDAKSPLKYCILSTKC